MDGGILTNPFFRKVHAHRGMIFPLAVISMLGVILVPLPPAALDLLLVCSITISVLMLLTAMSVKTPLEFSVFPSLLLAVTLFRLVLNVATMRLILTAGGPGVSPASALHDAGDVVAAFGQFVTGNSLAVGVLVFLIIFVIQFVVITKGAGRIAEVAARFKLDAMPGKQLAIDADLNAGHIDEAEARRRRETVSREADFYGTMDGASKYVRGEAIAAAIITLVNVLGGLYVGMADHKWALGDCLKLYTVLSIGDGLVSQVPALVVSLGAGLMVTRSGSRGDLGDEVAGQVFARPKVLAIAAGFLVLLAFTGLPPVPMLVLAACCGGLAWVLTRGEKDAARADAVREQEKTELAKAAAARREAPDTAEKLLGLEPLELELGYGLARMADPKRGGDLLERIAQVRRRVALELGIIVPSVKVRDNLELDANDYVVRIKGQPVARGETYPEQFLATDAGDATAAIPGGTLTGHPAFGLPSYWVTESERAEAARLNYTLTDAADVLTAHLTAVVRGHAHELLTRQEVKNLLDNLKARAPAVVEEVVPAQVNPGELQKVMQNLLRERVPVRDLETILETLGDWAPRTKDVDALSECVRGAMARTICRQHADGADRLWCLTLDPALEELIDGHLERGDCGTTNTMPAQTAERVAGRVAEKAAELARAGRAAVVLCSPQVRLAVRRTIEATLPQVAVLSYSEVVPEVSVEAVAMVGLDE